MATNLDRAGGLANSNLQPGSTPGAAGLSESEVDTLISGDLAPLQRQLAALAKAQHGPSPISREPVYSLQHRRITYDNVPVGEWYVSATLEIVSQGPVNFVPRVTVDPTGVDTVTESATFDVAPAGGGETTLYEYHAVLDVNAAGDLIFNLTFADATIPAAFQAARTTDLSLTYVGNPALRTGTADPAAADAITGKPVIFVRLNTAGTEIESFWYHSGQTGASWRESELGGGGVEAVMVKDRLFTSANGSTQTEFDLSENPRDYDLLEIFGSESAGATIGAGNESSQLLIDPSNLNTAEDTYPHPTVSDARTVGVRLVSGTGNENKIRLAKGSTTLMGVVRRIRGWKFDKTTSGDGRERTTLWTPTGTTQQIAQDTETTLDLTADPRDFDELIFYGSLGGGSIANQTYSSEVRIATDFIRDDVILFEDASAPSGASFGCRFVSGAGNENKVVVRRGNNANNLTHLREVEGVKFSVAGNVNEARDYDFTGKISGVIREGIVHYPAPGVMGTDPYNFVPNLAMSDLGGIPITALSTNDGISLPAGRKYRLQLIVPRIPDSSTTSTLTIRRRPTGGSFRTTQPWEEGIVEQPSVQGRLDTLMALIDLTDSTAVAEEVMIRFDHEDTSDSLTAEGLHLLVTEFG